MLCIAVRQIVSAKLMLFTGLNRCAKNKYNNLKTQSLPTNYLKY